MKTVRLFTLIIALLLAAPQAPLAPAARKVHLLRADLRPLPLPLACLLQPLCAPQLGRQSHGVQGITASVCANITLSTRSACSRNLMKKVRIFKILMIEKRLGHYLTQAWRHCAPSG